MLIDPPFEQEVSSSALLPAQGRAATLRKRHLSVLVPIKDPRPIAVFHKGLAGLQGRTVAR